MITHQSQNNFCNSFIKFALSLKYFMFFPRSQAESIKKMFPGVEIVEWGKVADFNMIINATSLGLKKEDEIKLNFSEIGSNKLFFDVIYSPPETKFLSKAKEFGNQIENGRMMFIYQAQAAFKIWHNILPKIDNNILN